MDLHYLPNHKNNALISLKAASLITGLTPATILKKSENGGFPPVAQNHPVMFCLTEVLLWDSKNRSSFVKFHEICSILNRSKSEVIEFISLGIFPSPVKAYPPAENLDSFVWLMNDIIKWKQHYFD